MFRVIVCLALLNFAGCNILSTNTPADPEDNTLTDPTPQTNPNPLPPGVNVNGAWQYAAAGDILSCCLTIENQQVSLFDEQCNTNPLTIISTRITAIRGTGVAIGVVTAASEDSAEFTIYAFNLNVLADGTMTGTAVVRYEPDGPVLAENITWTSQ